MGEGAGIGKLMRSEAGKGLTLISPTFVYALLLLAAPLAMILLLSFWTQEFLTIVRDFQLGNYQEARLRLFHRLIDRHILDGLAADGRDRREAEQFLVPEG